MNGVISGGPENNNVALLNEGGTARIEGGNVKGNIVVKGGTLTLAGGTITGDITVSGGKLVLEGAATVTGKITVESGTAVFSSGTVNGEVSNSGGTLDISDSINVKGRVSTSAGSTNISGGTLANVATSGSGTTTITGNAKITGNVSTSGGTTTITGGSVDGDVTNNGGGSTVVSGGSFKNPVDPRFLSNVEHLSISGTDSASVRYAYSKEKLADGHDVAIDVKDAQDGLLILDMGFKSGQKDAGSAIEASMVSLVPGWKYTQTTQPKGNNTMWVVLYGATGTYTADFSESGNSVWQSDDYYQVECKKPGFGVIQFSFDKESKTDRLTASNYTASLTQVDGEASTSATIAISSVEYDLAGGSKTAQLPPKTFLGPRETVTITNVEPTKDYESFKGSWNVDGEEYKAGQTFKTTDIPKEYKVMANWNLVAPEFDLELSENLSGIKAGESCRLTATISNTAANSHTKNVTLKFYLPIHVRLAKGQDSVTFDAKNYSLSAAGNVQVSDTGDFTVTVPDLKSDESIAITYELKVDGDAPTDEYAVQVNAVPEIGNEVNKAQTIGVIAKPVLALEMASKAEGSVDAGSALELSAVLANTAAGSDAGSTTVTFELPEDMSLSGEPSSVEVADASGAPIEDVATSTAERGFKVTVPNVEGENPITIAYAVVIDREAPTGDKTIKASAAPAEGNDTSGSTMVHVVALPKLTIETPDVELVQGRGKVVATTVSNTIESTGATTVDFRLPQGVTLASGDVSTISAKSGASSLDATGIATTDQGFTVKVDDITPERPLVVTYTVMASNEASDSGRIEVIASPTRRPAGEEDFTFSGAANLSIGLAPAISIVAGAATLQQGLAKELAYTVKNTVAGSNAGQTTITLTLPAGVRVEGGKDGVETSPNATDVKVDEGGPATTVTVTVPDITSKEPLGITLRLEADASAASSSSIDILAETRDDFTAEASQPLTVIARPELTLAVSPSDAPSVEQGSRTTFEVTVANTVPSSETGRTTVIFTLPEGGELTGSASVTSGTGTVAVDGHTVTVTAEQGVAHRAPLGIALAVEAANGAKPGEKSVDISVTSANAATQTTTSKVNVVAKPVLQLAMAGPDAETTIDAGSTLNLTTKLENIASGSSAGKTTIDVSLPKGVMALKGDVSAVTVVDEWGSAVEAVERRLTANGFSISIEDLKGDASIAIGYEVEVDDTAPTQEVTVAANARTDRGVEAESASLTIHVVALPKLAFATPEAFVLQGHGTQMQTTVRNEAEGSATGNTTITFTLPEGVTLDGGVVAKIGEEIQSVRQSTSDFTVTIPDGIEAETPLVVTYGVQAGSEVTPGEQDVRIDASYRNGMTASSTARLNVETAPKLAIDTPGIAIQQGREATLSYVVKNQVPGTETGKVKVTFELPRGLSLVDGASGVNATRNDGQNVKVSVADNTITVTTENLSQASPLTVKMAVRADDEADPGDASVKIVANTHVEDEGKSDGITAQGNITVIAKSKLAIKTDPDARLSLEQGTSSTLTATVENVVEESSTGPATVTFAFPQGAGLNVSATVKSGDADVATMGDSIKVTAQSGVVHGRPLEIELTVEAEDAAPAGTRVLAIAAEPTEGMGAGTTKDVEIETIAKPVLTLATTKPQVGTVDAGSTQTLETTLSNTAAGSHAGRTTIEFRLSEQMSLANGTSSVRVTGSSGEPVEGAEVRADGRDFTVMLSSFEGGASVVVSYDVTVDATSATGTQKINATATCEKDVSANEAISLGVTALPSIAIETRPAAVTKGHGARVTTTIANEAAGGPTGRTTVTFALPKGLALADGVAPVKATVGGTPEAVEMTNGGFKVSVDDIPAGSSLKVIYDVTAGAEAEVGQNKIEVAVDPARRPADEATLRARGDILVSPRPVLAIAASGDKVQQGLTKTLAYVVSNGTPDSDTGATTVTLTLPEGLVLEGEGAVKATPAATSVTVGEDGRTVTLVAPKIAHGADLFITMDVAAEDTAKPGPTTLGIAAKTAEGDEATATQRLTIIAKPSLELTLDPAETISLRQGEETYLTATLANAVQDSETGQTEIAFELPEDSGLTVEATDLASGETATPKGSAVTVTADGVASGDPVVVRLAVKASEDARAVQRTLGVKVSPKYGADTSANVTIEVEEELGLAIATMEPPTIQQGCDEQFTATVTNTVPRNKTGETTVTFTLPEGVSLASDEATDIAASGASATVTRLDDHAFKVTASNIPGDLPLTITYLVRVDGDATVDGKTIGIAASSTKHVTAQADQALSVSPMPMLSIEATKSAIQQGTDSKLIATVDNAVDGSSTGPISVTFAPLPEGMGLKGTDGAVSVKGGKNARVEIGDGSFTILADDLKGGGTLSITYTVEAAEDAPVDACAIPIAIDARNPFKGSNSAQVDLSITQKPQLAIANAENADGVEVQQGLEVELEGSVSNEVDGSSTGPATVTVSLPEGVLMAGGLDDSVRATCGDVSVETRSLSAGNGFSLMLPDGLDSRTDLAFDYRVKVTSEAAVDKIPITITATPLQGDGDTSTTYLDVIGEPALALGVGSTDMTYIQQGEAQTFELSLLNDTARSKTGAVKVDVKLPNGILFTGDSRVEGVDGAEVETWDGAKGLTFELADLPDETPATLRFDVRAEDDSTPNKPYEIGVSATLDEMSGTGDEGAIDVTIVHKPVLAISGQGASVQQGKAATLDATIENRTERSRTGETTLSFSLPKDVRLDGDAANAVSAHAGDVVLPVTSTDGGFSVTVDELRPGTPIDVAYDVTVADDATLGMKIIEMRAVPEKGAEAVARTSVDVTANGRLAIDAEDATIEVGHVGRLGATISNETPGAQIGRTTVTFTLPEGIELDGDLASAVSAAYGSTRLTPKALTSGFSVTVDDLAYGEMLGVGLNVHVAEDAEPGAKTITILADPATTGLASTEAELTVTVPEEVSEGPLAEVVAESAVTDATEVSTNVEEATGGLASMDEPLTQVGEDARTATVAWTVRLAVEADSSEADAGSFNDETVGAVAVASVFRDARVPLIRAKTSVAQSYDDPGIVLEDLGNASDEAIADFGHRCVAAVLPGTSRALDLDAGTQTSLLLGKKMTILVTTDEGTADESIITYTFSFEAKSSKEEAATGEVSVYRLYNPYDGQHLFTADANEYESLSELTAGGWVQEGERYVLPADSSVEIHRLYNPNNGDHLYSTDPNEVSDLQGAGWVDEGVKLHGAEGEGTVPIFRLWNRFMTGDGGLGSHLWTGSADEYNELPGLAVGGWLQEGEVWRALRLAQG